MKIFVGNNPPETHIVQQQLMAEGIECEVRGEGVFGLRGEVPFDESSLPYVWLFNKEQEMMARAVIQDWQKRLRKAVICRGYVQLAMRLTKRNLASAGTVRRHKRLRCHRLNEIY